MRTAISIFILSCISVLGQGAAGTGLRNPSSLMMMHGIFSSNQINALSPKLWLMADVGCYSNAGINFCSNGVGCARWVDQSGLGNDVGQVTFANQPKYYTNMINGLPALAFGGSTTKDMTNKFAADLSQPNTVFVVFFPSNNVTTTMIGGRVSSKGNMISFGSVSELYVYAGGGANVIMTPEILRWHQLSVIYDYPGAYQQATVFSKKRLSAFGGVNVGARVIDGFTVGATYIPDQAFQGMISEIILFNSRLTSTQIYGIEMYLAKKYRAPQPNGLDEAF